MKPFGLISLSKTVRGKGIYAPVPSRSNALILGFILGLITGIIIGLI